MRAIKPYIISKEYELRKRRQLIVTLLVIACLLSLILFYNPIKNYTGDFFRKAKVFGNSLLTKKEGSNITKVLSTVTVTVDNANIRKAPSKSSYVIAKASKESTLGVVETKGDWYKVTFMGGTFIREKEPDADFGWIHKSMVIPQPEVPSQPIPESAGIDNPPIPYEDHGACPFEGCVYREWVVSKDTSIYKDKERNSPIVFAVKRGERVTAVTGVVVTTKPGKVEVLKDTFLESVGKVHKGDIIYLLTYKGEGFWKVWYKGKLFEASFPIVTQPGAEWRREESKDFRLIQENQSIWWVELKNNNGQIGWSNQPENFDNKDLFGGTTDNILTKPPSNKNEISQPKVQPKIRLSSDSLDFGEIRVRTNGYRNLDRDRTIYISNKGNADLVISKVTLPSFPFEISKNDCIGNIKSNGRCRIDVKTSFSNYQASTDSDLVDSYKDKLEIHSNDGVSTVNLYAKVKYEKAPLRDYSDQLPRKVKQITGEVIALYKKDNTISVRKIIRDKKVDVTATCDSKTIIKMGNEKKTLADLKVGDKVTMKYVEDDVKNFVKSIAIKQTFQTESVSEATRPVESSSSMPKSNGWKKSREGVTYEDNQ